MALLGKEAPILRIDGKSYRDLNKNGKLDIYEDINNNIDDRVEDLISQMTIEEKAGSMFFTLIGIHENGDIMDRPEFPDMLSYLINSSSDMLINKKINHFNIQASHKKESILKWHNEIQRIGECSRLGIPITIGSNPRHGTSKKFGASTYTPDFSKWPTNLGLAATRDSLLVLEHGNIARQEYKALGIRVALGPMADLATEPRWARIDGTFGEDANLSSKLTYAYIKGLQGDRIDKNSVSAMVKHFPGSGPLDNGKSSHFPPGTQSYQGNNFEYHLKPFESAFKAGVSSVMPFYSIAKNITKENVAAGYNKEIINGILRERFNFDGIICTDWNIITDLDILGMLFKPASAHGVEELNTKQRIEKIIFAGVDQIGGETLTSELSELIKNGVINKKRIDESLRRIMREKFRLGLFDNPYIDKSGFNFLNKQEFIDKGIEAQQKALVLLKNKNNILPLNSKTKISLKGFSKEFSSQIDLVSNEDADVLILKLKTPSGIVESEYLMERLFGAGQLDFTEEELKELIPLIKSKPTIVVMQLKRPAIFTEINQFANAVIADFDVEDKIILDLIFGKFSPTGKLPIQLPSSMQSVLDQKEDLPFDSKNALYEFGHGLSYD